MFFATVTKPPMGWPEAFAYAAACIAAAIAAWAFFKYGLKNI